MRTPAWPPIRRTGRKRVKAPPAAPACRGAAVVANRAIAIAALSVILAGLTVTYGRAQSELNAQFHHFQDTRGVTVLSPTVDLSQDFTDRTTLRASFGVDAISAASDSCARCHRQGVNSQRRVASVSVTRKFGDLKWTIGGEYSRENFYRSTTAMTSFSRDLNSGSTTVAGGYTFSLNQPQLHPLQQVEKQYASSGYVALTQTLTKTTVAQVGYEVAQVNGFQSNPFLRADVQGLMLVGQAPDLRTRQTLTARARQALPDNTYLEANYRHYFDSWQLRSNSFDVGLSTISPSRCSQISSTAGMTRPARFFISRSTTASRSSSRPTSAWRRLRRACTRANWSSRPRHPCGFPKEAVCCCNTSGIAPTTVSRQAH